MLYAEMDAAIEAGATLTELQEWLDGVRFSVRFKERVVAWNNMRHLISAHREEAAASKRGK